MWSAMPLHRNTAPYDSDAERHSSSDTAADAESGPLVKRPISNFSSSSVDQTVHAIPLVIFFSAFVLWACHKDVDVPQSLLQGIDSKAVMEVAMQPPPVVNSDTTGGGDDVAAESNAIINEVPDKTSETAARRRLYAITERYGHSKASAARYSNLGYKEMSADIKRAVL